MADSIDEKVLSVTSAATLVILLEEAQRERRCGWGSEDWLKLIYVGNSLIILI